jgi:hypothetical protein
MSYLGREHPAENHSGTTELRCSARVAQQQNIFAGCSKRLFSKAAASEEARRTLRYVEPLSDARTPLADFFSILLGTGRRRQLHFDARVVFIDVFVEVCFDDAVVVDAESLTEGILRDLEPAIDVSS